MKKQIIITIIILVTMIIFTMRVINAVDIIAGTNYSFQSEQFEYWYVTENSSNMEGMTIDWVDGNTILYFDILYKPDSFNLILFNNDTEIITEHHYSNGGTRIVHDTIYKTETKYIDKDCEKPITPVTPVTPEPKIITNTKIENKTPLWIFGIILLLVIGIGTLIYFLIKTIKDYELLNENNEELPEGFELED